MPFFLKFYKFSLCSDVNLSQYQLMYRNLHFRVIAIYYLVPTVYTF